jgi:LacI family transcriptional regulator
MKKRVKLEDIANVVGVTKMAVSLAMRGDRSISEETTKKIQTVARELGYIPNRIAQNLVKGKSNTIALLISAPLHDDYQNQILNGAIPYAMKRGYTISVGPMARPGLEESYIEKYKNMMVDGFLAFHSLDNTNYKKLKEDGIPFVLYTKYFEDLSSDYVVCDDEKGGYLMTKHLIELGHRRVGFVYDSLLNHSSEVLNRIKGYRTAMDVHGLSYHDIPLIPFHLHYHANNMSSEDILRRNPQFEERMNAPDRPSALFVCNDITASSVYIALKKMGLKIPQDISVGGYEGVYLGSIMDPPLTTMATSIKKIGEQACQTLIDKIEGIIPDSTLVQISIDPKLLVRGSASPPSLIDISSQR